MHGLGMQVDATVELVLLFVKTHHEPPWERVCRKPVNIEPRK